MPSSDGIEPNHVVKPFNDNTVSGDCLAIPWLIEAARLLSEEFEAAVKIDRESMFRRFLFLAPLFGRECIEYLFLRFKLRVP